MHERAMNLDAHPTNPTPVSSFVTLTYADAAYAELDNGSLRYKDWQLFAKKLRNQCGPFRFLMCGEYGDAGERAHFHAILFGLDFRQDRTHLKKTPTGQDLFVSKILDDQWGHGIHSIGEVTPASASYVASYIQKKVNGKIKKQHYEKVNTITGEIFHQEPEFGQMSRNPGLGKTWIEKYHPEVYPRDEVFHDGKFGTPPAFYDRWYAKHFPDKMEEIKEKRKIKAVKWSCDNTPERLATKEKVFKAGFADYQRKRNKTNHRG